MLVTRVSARQTLQSLSYLIWTQPLTLYDIRIRLSVSLQFIYVFTNVTVSLDQDLVSLLVHVLVPWVFIRFVI